MMRSVCLVSCVVALAACAEKPRGSAFETLGVPGDAPGAAVQEPQVVFETGAPTGDPLTPEEQALYDSLTPEQQARADAFLAAGSTVASSLKGDE